MFVAHTLLTRGEAVSDGRSAILFATVAGVSLGLMTGGPTPPPRGPRRGAARLVVLVRAAVLVLLGLALTAFVAPPLAVILDYYGFGYVLVLGMLFLPRAVLAVSAAVLAFAAPPLVAALTGAADFDDVPEALQPFARWLTHGDYPMLVWITFLLVGLVLARSDLHSRSTARLAALGGTLAAVLGYGSVLVVPGTTAAAHSGSTAEVVGSGGVAVAVIGILCLADSATGAAERFAAVARWILAPVAAAGSMPLTLYTAHAIALALVRETGVLEDDAQGSGLVLAALVVTALVFATLWRRFVGSGPLEAGLRRLTRIVGGERSRVAP